MYKHTNSKMSKNVIIYYDSGNLTRIGCVFYIVYIICLWFGIPQARLAQLVIITAPQWWMDDGRALLKITFGIFFEL